VHALSSFRELAVGVGLLLPLIWSSSEVGVRVGNPGKHACATAPEPVCTLACALFKAPRPFDCIQSHAYPAAPAVQGAISSAGPAWQQHWAALATKAVAEQVQ
jgi:hypothetical protein